MFGRETSYLDYVILGGKNVVSSIDVEGDVGQRVDGVTVNLIMVKWIINYQRIKNPRPLYLIYSCTCASWTVAASYQQ